MKKNWLKKITRIQPDSLDRSKYLRLDKNERVIEFEKKFINYLKIKINTHNLASYPNIFRIKKLISSKLKISGKMIYLSAGSDLSLKTCFELFTRQKDRVIILEPTFGMVNVYCNLYNLKSIKIGYNKNLNLDIKKLFDNISRKISLVVIANPNSPTGTVIDKKMMLKILDKCKKFNIPIVLDEAYEGFYSVSYVKYLRKYKNLIITRTFSKSFGIAGLRAGYAISSPKISKLLNKYRPMYEINSVSCLAIEFLFKNYSIVKKHIKEVIKAKNFLKSELEKMNIDFIDTKANFIHIKLGKNLKFYEKKFKSNLILFRKGPGVKGLQDFARFSIGSISNIKKILKIVKKIYGKNR